MITCKALRTNRRQFLALTGLTLSEFQHLLTTFPQAYQQHYPANHNAEGQPRQRAVGGGCKGRLEQPEDKVLFLLVYLKTYPLQAVMDEPFGLSTSQVNYWIHRLLPVLRSALDDLGVLPERDPTHFAQAQDDSRETPRLIIDATERRRQRPKNPDKQALFYSGRKKKHCDKNVVIVHTRRKRIDYLSQTYPGKTHEKKIADEEGISYPPESTLYKDTGFQGYEPAVKKTCQAKKNPPRGKLTEVEKRTNRKLAQIRVKMEHDLAGVKRSRIVKDVLRNTKGSVSDTVMEAACGLHNVRDENRKRRLKN